MRIKNQYIKCIKPSAELLTPNKKDIGMDFSHIAKCARVCYGRQEVKSTKDRDKKMVDGLILNHHLSMLRHDSRYFIINVSDDNYKYINQIIDFLAYYNPYVEFAKYNSTTLYLSTNSQFIHENINAINDEFYYRWNLPPLDSYEVPFDEFIQKEIGYSIARFTFVLTTNIGVSRELNRVSPNNIAEASTRYIRANANKDGAVGVVCLPEDIKFKKDEYNAEPVLYFGKGQYIAHPTITTDYTSEYWNYGIIDDKHIPLFLSWHEAFVRYNELINNKVSLDLARSVLPLATATTVVYTYSIKEWKKIINLRYHGTTGKPHPDAKAAISKVREVLLDLGYIV